MNDERIEELVQAYLRGEASPGELEELKKLLDAGDETSRRAASMLADGGMIAGWFRAEGDLRFVAEAMAATETRRDDPEFVGKTLERIEQARSRRRSWRRPSGGRPWGFIPALAAAGLLAAVVAIVVFASTRGQREGTAGGSAQAPGPAVEERRETADSPDQERLDAIKDLERLRQERKKQEEELARIEREREELVRQQRTAEAQAKGETEIERKRQLERLAEEERKAQARVERKEKQAPTTTREKAPLLLAATVERVQGEAFLVAEEGKTAAKPGQAVYGGQGFETSGPKGLLAVRFADGTRLELAGDAAVQRVWERQERKGKGLFLARGVVTADVGKQPAGQPMVFTTAHAEATVLGTRLTLAVAGNSTRLDVREGRVRLARLPAGAAVEVPAGFYAVAGPGQDPELKHEHAIALSFQDDVSPGPRYSGTRDAHFGEHKSEVDRNNGTGAQVWVDGDCRPPQGDDRYALIKWDLSAIPPGSMVISASIAIQVVNNPAGQPFNLCEMKREWIENQATWNVAASKRPWQAPGARGPQERGGVILGALAPKVKGPYSAALNPAGVAVVQSWIDNPLTNHGFWLGNPDNGDALGFESREAVQPANRPKLTIVFVPKGR